MKESSTYQAILAEGRAQGYAEGLVEAKKKVILQVGTSLLGTPNNEARARFASIDDTAQIDQMLDHVTTVQSWSELLGERRYLL